MKITGMQDVGKMHKMIRACSTGLLILVLHALPQAQTSVTWDELADVKFDKGYDADLGIDLLVAAFGEHVSKLDSQEIFITGYILPLNALGTSYVISRFPNANCFFCGGAGPETIVELKLKPGNFKRYATDTRATFKGFLLLNTDNFSSLTYVLHDAVQVD